PATDWMYTADPGKGGLGLKRRRVPVPRGKMLGGSSGLNYMAYVRGHPGDFDSWAKNGAAGWSYADVLPYFRKSEGLTPSGEIVIDAEAHNAAGPLGVSVRSPVLPGAREFVEAAEAAGIPRGDYNGRDREQTLPPASSRTLSPRLPAGRLYQLPMDSPRFSAILPRATETCVLCRTRADGDIETYVDMSRNGSPVAMAPSIAARLLQLFLKAAFRCSSSYGGRSPLSFQVDWLSKGPTARRVPYCKTHALDVASTKCNAELIMPVMWQSSCRT